MAFVEQTASNGAIYWVSRPPDNTISDWDSCVPPLTDWYTLIHNASSDPDPQLLGAFIVHVRTSSANPNLNISRPDNGSLSIVTSPDLAARIQALSVTNRRTLYNSHLIADCYDNFDGEVNYEESAGEQTGNYTVEDWGSTLLGNVSSGTLWTDLTDEDTINKAIDALTAPTPDPVPTPTDPGISNQLPPGLADLLLNNIISTDELILTKRKAIYCM
jgi:hypothetical protein